MRQLATFDSRDSQPVIITAARIRTVDSDRPSAEAMLTHRGVILAIGTLAEVEEAAAGAGLPPERVDYEGAPIVPGLKMAYK